MEQGISICVDLKCGWRLDCKKFARAMDVNSGKITKGYYIVEKYEYENNSEKSIYAICKNKESLDKLVEKILETENVYKSEFEDDAFFLLYK
jgi:hypothetical protein